MDDVLRSGAFGAVQAKIAINQQILHAPNGVVNILA